MRINRFALSIAVACVLLAIGGCSAPTPGPTISTPNVPAKALVPASPPDFSDQAFIYGGVSSSVELIERLKNGTHDANGTVRQHGAKLRRDYLAIAPTLAPLLMKDLKPLEGSLLTSGEVRYGNNILGESMVCGTRTRHPTLYSKGLDRVSATVIMRNFNVISTPVLIYFDTNMFGPDHPVMSGIIIEANGQPCQGMVFMKAHPVSNPTI